MGIGDYFEDAFGTGSDDYGTQYGVDGKAHPVVGWRGYDPNAAGAGTTADQVAAGTASDADRQALLSQAAGINQTAGGIGNSATRIGQSAQVMSGTANSITGLSDQLGAAPSAAALAAKSAEQTGNAQAMSQAASARGANSALMMREAMANNDARDRQIASDAATASANELSSRYGTRAGMLGAAAGVQGNVASAYGSQAGALGTAANAQNAAGGLMSGARTGDIAQRGQDITATQGANQLQQTHDDAMYAGQVAKHNKSDSDSGGALDSAFSMIGMSDMRLKTDVDPLPISNAKPPESSEKKDDKGSGSSDMMSTLLAAYGGGGMAMSDENTKTDVHKLLEMATSPSANAQNLGKVEGVTYRYKPEDAKDIGQDSRTRPGVMAQDVERAPAGKAVVLETPKGKALDVNRALGFSMAGVAGLDKRLKLLEDALGRKGKAA